MFSWVQSITAAKCLDTFVDQEEVSHHLFILCKEMHCQKLLYKLFAFTELEEQQKIRDEVN